jgi:hypothetical protein
MQIAFYWKPKKGLKFGFHLKFLNADAYFLNAACYDDYYWKHWFLKELHFPLRLSFGKINTVIWQD